MVDEKQKAFEAAIEACKAALDVCEDVIAIDIMRGYVEGDNMRQPQKESRKSPPSNRLWPSPLNPPRSPPPPSRPCTRWISGCGPPPNSWPL